MNANQQPVPTHFAPEVAYEVEPAPPAPFRARQATQLERLKARLLAERLPPRPGLPLAASVQRAAREAAALAWTTRYPLLVFPELIDELAAAARQRVARQERIFRRSRELLAT